LNWTGVEHGDGVRIVGSGAGVDHDRNRAQDRALVERRGRRGDAVAGHGNIATEHELAVTRVLLGVAAGGDRALLALADLVDLVDDEHEQHADDDADHDFYQANAPLGAPHAISVGVHGFFPIWAVIRC
jgi:hypothetical protein